MPGTRQTRQINFACSIVAVAAFAALAVSAGCDRTTSETAPSNSATSALSATTNDATTLDAATTTESASAADAPQVFDIHPWPAEFHQLVATVRSTHDVEYREAPSREATVVARQTLESDSRISFGDTQTQVREPFVAKATRSVKVSGTNSEGERIEQQLVPGDAYEAFLYAGEGMCHVKIKGAMVVGDCPDKQHFQAEEWDGQAPVPVDFDLWLKTRKGWLLVDRDAVELESVSTL